MTNTEVYQGCSEVLGTSELLSLIHLGLCNYSQTIHDIVRKDQKWEWTERQEEAFKKLKKRFTKELVLTALDLNKKIRMEVDASDYATGGILSIKYEDGRWRPVAYLSKSLTEIERNYKIYNKKILAVIRKLKN